jgi:hypothetical protein
MEACNTTSFGRCSLLPSLFPLLRPSPSLRMRRLMARRRTDRMRVSAHCLRASARRGSVGGPPSFGGRATLRGAPRAAGSPWSSRGARRVWVVPGGCRCCCSASLSSRRRSAAPPTPPPPRPLKVRVCAASRLGAGSRRGTAMPRDSRLAQYYAPSTAVHCQVELPVNF